jgi:hypothetical protein
MFYLLVEDKRPMFLALLTAVENFLWCFAQSPVFFLGLIFPKLEINRLSKSVSLKSTS